MIARHGYPHRNPSPSTPVRNGPWFGRKRSYRAVRSLQEVIRAWRGVYASYLRANLISPNPHEVHLISQAVEPSVLVVIDSAADRATEPHATEPHAGRAGLATVTVIPDTGRGIPLDDMYRRELDLLREMRREPIEAVLLADDRDVGARSMETMFGLMRWAFYYGLYLRKSDLVFGVHPRHAPFYRRMLGAVDLGAETTCARVRHAPVVGLRIDLLGMLTAVRRPRAIQYFMARPLARDEMEDRFPLSWSAIRGTVIEEYLGVDRGVQHDILRAALNSDPAALSVKPQPRRRLSLRS